MGPDRRLARPWLAEPGMSKSFILRDVHLHDGAYPLARPLRPGKAGQADEAVLATPESQLAASYAEGFAAGRAAQADELAMQQQLAMDQEIKTCKEQAALEGHAEGLAKGLEEARLAAQEGHAEMQRRIASLGLLLDAFSSQLEATWGAVESDLVGLCHEVVCKILGESAATPQGIRAMVAQALETLSGEPLAVHLHPEDLDACTAGMNSGARWRWIADRSIQLGGIIVRGRDGSLDATLDTQLKVLSETLLSVRRGRSAGRQGTA